MSQSITHNCDICQKTKTSVNHWWKGYILTAAGVPAGALIMKWEMLPPEFVAKPTVVTRLSPEMEKQKDFCGQAHAIQWLSQQLSGTS